MDEPKTVLIVNERHVERAARFCRRHRHFTTTEAMDDLAAEFEKVERVAKNSTTPTVPCDGDEPLSVSMRLHWWCIRMSQRLDRPGYPVVARVFDHAAGGFARIYQWIGW